MINIKILILFSSLFLAVNAVNKTQTPNNYEQNSIKHGLHEMDEDKQFYADNEVYGSKQMSSDSHKGDFDKSSEIPISIKEVVVEELKNTTAQKNGVKIDEDPNEIKKKTSKKEINSTQINSVYEDWVDKDEDDLSYEQTDKPIEMKQEKDNKAPKKKSVDKKKLTPKNGLNQTEPDYVSPLIKESGDEDSVVENEGNSVVENDEDLAHNKTEKTLGKQKEHEKDNKAPKKKSNQTSLNKGDSSKKEETSKTPITFKKTINYKIKKAKSTPKVKKVESAEDNFLTLPRKDSELDMSILDFGQEDEDDESTLKQMNVFTVKPSTTQKPNEKNQVLSANSTQNTPEEEESKIKLQFEEVYRISEEDDRLIEEFFSDRASDEGVNSGNEADDAYAALREDVVSDHVELEENHEEELPRVQKNQTKEVPLKKSKLAFQSKSQNKAKDQDKSDEDELKNAKVYASEQDDVQEDTPKAQLKQTKEEMPLKKSVKATKIGFFDLSKNSLLTEKNENSKVENKGNDSLKENIVSEAVKAETDDFSEDTPKAKLNQTKEVPLKKSKLAFQSKIQNKAKDQDESDEDELKNVKVYANGDEAKSDDGQVNTPDGQVNTPDGQVNTPDTQLKQTERNTYYVSLIIPEKMKSLFKQTDNTLVYVFLAFIFMVILVCFIARYVKGRLAKVNHGTVVNHGHQRDTSMTFSNPVTPSYNQFVNEDSDSTNPAVVVY